MALTGRDLATRFYHDVVAPVLAPTRAAPHAAALLGSGSEVLGFDDATSTDHDFGARAQVFLPAAAAADAPQVQAAVAAALPATFLGAPVLGVEVTTVASFFAARVGFDPLGPITPIEWLSAPSQGLASVTAGAVFADGTGELAAARVALAWYPDDVWRALLAAQWLRVAQEEPFVGRTGGRGDDLGSAVIAARLARDLMRVAFLVERRYAPYPKWFGTAFGTLAIAPELVGPLRAALTATGWREREAGLCAAGETLLARTNDLGLAPSLPPARRAFYERDITVVGADRMTVALAGAVADPAVRALLERRPRREGVPRFAGGIDQVTDSTDVLTDAARCRAVTEAALAPPATRSS